jgi:methionyl-tRNA formyltransferase
MNLIRGLSPVPGAFFIYNNKRYKVYKSSVLGDENIEPGEIKISENRILAGCIDSTLEIMEIQPEGRNRMSAQDFARGYAF